MLARAEMSSIERSGKKLYRSENPSLLGSGFRVFKIATKTDDIIMEVEKLLSISSFGRLCNEEIKNKAFPIHWYGIFIFVMF